MTRPARTLIRGSLHQRLYTGWIRRQNPFLETQSSRQIIFLRGVLTGIAVCAVIAWVTMR